MARPQMPDLKTIEPYDVSFAEIRSDEKWLETIQKVATAIDVQFTESSKQLPFVPFKEFEKLLREEKVFLFGPSGCGKSRTIIELLRSKKGSYDRIFVINPSNPAGLDSSRESISTLSQQFGRKDLVIWDNFPEGLVKRDLQNAFGALEIVNSRSVQNLYISLKPTYLEMYRGLTIGIPDIYTHEITCDLETMKALIRAYGMHVEQYRGVFEKYISPNIDTIARTLWQKQPLSLTIVDYYKALVGKTTDQIQATIDSSKCLQVSQEWLPVYDYFERQFEVMKNIRGREQDVDFLYILRFCYEAGFSRTQTSIARLQKAIFGSSAPVEPTQKMGTWVFLSGQNYAMHDSAKNAVRLTDYPRMKIISYLTDHFSEIIPKGNGELHSLGLFLGKNIQFIPNDTGRGIVPDQIYGFMKKNAVFERAFGHGVGENFELLDEVLQMLILEHVDTDIEFGVGLADSLGERFMEIDDNNRKRILKKTYHGLLFARYFGQSVGRLYGKMSNEQRSIVVSHAERNPQFADGLGMGLGYMYATLEPALQDEIMHKAQKSFDLSRGLGFGFGLTFALLQEQDAKNMVSVADKNSELDVGFGMGLAVSYSNLAAVLRKFVLDRVATDCEFAFGAGAYGAYFYKEACPKDLFILLHSNGEVAYGLGVGFGATFFYLPEQFQSELELLTMSNVKLDEGLGSGIGFVLKHLPTEVQERFIAKASASNAFAAGLGYGLGYTWQYIGDVLRQRAFAFANSNNDFARGLGTGLGSHLPYLKSTFFDQVISFANTNSEFDRGFGVGAVWSWLYHSDDAKRTIVKRMETSGEFARGIGFGLARIIQYFSTNEREHMLNRLAWDPMFSAGFGEGTAQFLWTIYGEANKLQFLKLTMNSPEMSMGLGIGLGFMYSYSKNELSHDTYKHIFKKDPNFRRGLGTGMGRAYKYLSKDAQLEALRMSEEDVEFAIGFGEGIGRIYNHLEDSQKELVMSYIDDGDAGFSRGLGVGFGSVFSYFEEDVKKDILTHIPHNGQLSLGLGAGLAMHISYLSEALAFKVFELARNNSLLAAGLGEGCGTIFPYLSQVTKDWLSSQVSIDGFAFGFGVGIGKIRRYLENSAFEKAAAFTKSNKFVEGFAIGLGSVSVNLSKDLLLESLSNATGEEGSFAKNFGFGLGHILSLLDSDKRKEILEIMSNKGEFLAGLGEGLGHYIPSTGSRAVEEIMHTTGSVNLARGAARGVTESFVYLNLAEVLGMLEYASSNSEFGQVLGEGLAEKFASLEEEKQSWILDALQKDSNFSRAFAKMILKNLAYISPQTGERIKDLAAKFPHLESMLQRKM
ncbi:MAG: hypothetical protein M3299_00235 [Thermoproteota archaeon]|nr:hypothetical protein [Thermoproteota archaeon]